MPPDFFMNEKENLDNRNFDDTGSKSIMDYNNKSWKSALLYFICDLTYVGATIVLRLSIVEEFILWSQLGILCIPLVIRL